jgi:RNA-directed DNA polymerase
MEKYRNWQLVSRLLYCNIYVRTMRAGQRVMENTTAFITRRLRLKVSQEKSAVAHPVERKFLGFSFTGGKQPQRRIAPKAIARFKKRVREITRRTRGVSIERMVEDLALYLRGWRAYVVCCQTPTVLLALEQCVRRRPRAVLWKQWKRGRTRFDELHKRGFGADHAARAAGSSDGP